MVQITINGKQIEVPEGTTVLRVAEAAGINIPRLCDHKELTPYGGCRLCIVEVQGVRVPMASCTLPVNNGMVVNTDTEALKKSRKFILSMLFSERNHFCPFCQVSGGDCELQNAAYAEEMTHWPIQPGWNNFVVDTSQPYFVLDNNRCILCRRCVRACAEMSGNFTLSVAERGAKSMIVADTDVPLGESSCIKCGSCVQVCPTGALIDKTSAYQSHDKDLQEVKSTCVGCSVGCSIKIMVRDNRIVRIEGDWEGSVNHGVLCEFGRYRALTAPGKRITSPMMKKNGKLEPVSWNEALKAVAGKLLPLASEKDGIAAIASTRLPAETLTAFKDLFAGNRLVTSMEEGLPTASTAQFAQKQGAFEGKLDMLRTADTVFCLGTDVGNAHMVAGFLFKRNLQKGTRLVNIDPEQNVLDELANLSLKPNAGSWLALIHGLQAIIVKEGLGRSLLVISDAEALIEKAVRETGITIEQLTQAARILANSITPVILCGNSITAQRDEVLVEEIYRLALLVGAVDQERAGLLSTKGLSNSLTAALLGLDQPFKLNGQQAVYVAAGDDRLSPSLAERLSKAPYLVVQASYESPLTEQADVVLPVTIWSEQEGHYINVDGRVQKAQKAIASPENVRDNLAVLNELATRMNMSLETNWQQAILGPQIQRSPDEFEELMNKPKIATDWICGCAGCHMSLLDMDERILKIVELADLRSTPITDLKEPDESGVDVGILEGGVNNSANEEVAHKMRARAKILVALGDCAVFGGVPAMRNFCGIEAALKRAYVEAESNEPGSEVPNDPELAIMTKARALHEVVPVDYNVPGCPPDADTIFYVLSELAQGRKPELKDEYLHWH